MYLNLTKALLLTSGALFAHAQDLEIELGQYYNNLSITTDERQKQFRVSLPDEFPAATDYLVIKAAPTSFGSDPDIYVYKANYETPVKVCSKFGADDCFINLDGESANTLYLFQVKCPQNCDFNLRAEYISSEQLEFGDRHFVRFENFSSKVIELKIPSGTTDSSGTTKMIEIDVTGETSYEDISAYVSLDNELTQMEDTDQPPFYLSNGKAFKFSNSDQGWCTRCNIYLMLSVQTAGKYFVQPLTFSTKNQIAEEESSRLVVDQQGQECLEYTITSNTDDLRVELFDLEGTSKVTVNPRTVRSDQDTSMIVSPLYARRTVVLTQELRGSTSTDLRRGEYQVCVNAISKSSVLVTVEEKNLRDRYEVADDMFYKVPIEAGSVAQFLYRGSLSKTQSTQLNVLVEMGTSETSYKNLEIGYKKCDSTSVSNCYFTETELSSLKGLSKLSKKEDKVTYGSIEHDPEDYDSPTTTNVYMFAVKNSNSGRVFADFKIDNLHTVAQNAKDNVWYANNRRAGETIYYSFDTADYDAENIEEINIMLESLNGDADLFVSQTNPSPSLTSAYDYSSQLDITHDQVTIKRSMAKNISGKFFIGVYCHVRSSYQLKWKPTYDPFYHNILNTATPVVNGEKVSRTFDQESDEAFFSFQPFWPESESSMVVLAAKVTFGKLYFYADIDKYPRHYLDSIEDENNVIAIDPSEIPFSRESTVFARLRPDFALYDVVSDREAIFDFYAFRQRVDNDFIALQLRDPTFGYSTTGKNANFRYFIVSATASYTFKVDTIVGEPTLLIKMGSEVEFKPTKEDVQSYDFEYLVGGETGVYEITQDMRENKEFNCRSDTTAYNMDGGAPKCVFYVSVECEQCVYSLEVDVSENSQVTQTAPRYLIDKQFVSGSVAEGKVEYYYFPFIAETTVDVAIVLNKTEGDSFLAMNVIADSAEGYENWKYPTSKSYDVRSKENSDKIPELITTCDTALINKCSEEEDNCILLIGVFGNHEEDDQESQYQLIVHGSDSRLVSEQPRNATMDTIGETHYYWFANAKSGVKPDSQSWEHFLGVNVEKEGNDVDMYVSFGDGRLPTKEDNDFNSEMFGADFVKLDSDDKFWSNNQVESKVGIFVVGIQAKTPQTNYALQSFIFSDDISYELGALESDVKVENVIIREGSYNLYQWYNWGARDFDLYIESSVGDVEVYLNFQSDVSSTNTLIASLPSSKLNSKRFMSVPEGSSKSIVVRRADLDAFCYYCFYFFTVTPAAEVKKIQFDIEVNLNRDDGEEATDIELNRATDNLQSFSLPQPGQTVQFKFLLESKEDFEIKIFMESSQAEMYIGLYPEQTSDYIWYTSLGIGTKVISVSTSDPNFYLGAYYYLTIQSTQSRVTGRIQLSQRNRFNLVADGVARKDNFWSDGDLVKFYVYEFPYTEDKEDRELNLKIETLTEFFQPLVLTNLISYDTRQKSFEVDQFPSIEIYENIYGNQVVGQLNLSNFEYDLEMETQKWSYLFVTVHNFVYGMTSEKKPVYYITFTSDDPAKTKEPQWDTLVDNSIQLFSVREAVFE